MQLTNNTNNTFYSHGYLCTGSWPSTTVQLIVWLLILVFSLTGNVLIIAIFFRDKTLRTTVNYFIVNICVSDLIVPIVILPMWITVEYDKNSLYVNITFPTLLCKVALIALSISVLVSLFSMTALAADRFRAIIFPMKPALFSPVKCCIAIAGIWLSTISFLVYYATESLPAIPSDYVILTCINPKWTRQTFFTVWIYFALECLSGIVLTACYLKVAIFLHRQKNSLQLASEVVKKRAKRNRKIITMLIIIVILFYVVYLQYYVMLLFFYIFRVSVPCVYIWFTFVISPIIYPVFNPVVYFVFNEKYRQGLWRILCCLPIVGLSQEN